MLYLLHHITTTIITHARPSLPVNPNPILTPPNRGAFELHDTAAIFCPNGKRLPLASASTSTSASNINEKRLRLEFYAPSLYSDGDFILLLILIWIFQIKCNTQCKINEENTGSSLSKVDLQPRSDLEFIDEEQPGYQLLHTHPKFDLESEVVQKTKKLPVLHITYGSFRISSEDWIKIFANLVELFFKKFNWQIFNNQ